MGRVTWWWSWVISCHLRSVNNWMQSAPYHTVCWRRSGILILKLDLVSDRLHILHQIRAVGQIRDFPSHLGPVFRVIPRANPLDKKVAFTSRPVANRLRIFLLGVNASWQSNLRFTALVLIVTDFRDVNLDLRMGLSFDQRTKIFARWSGCVRTFHWLDLCYVDSTLYHELERLQHVHKW